VYDAVLPPWGALVGLAHPNKAQRPQIEIRITIS